MMDIKTKERSYAYKRRAEELMGQVMALHKARTEMHEAYFAEHYLEYLTPFSWHSYESNGLMANGGHMAEKDFDTLYKKLLAAVGEDASGYWEQCIGPFNLMVDSGRIFLWVDEGDIQEEARVMGLTIESWVSSQKAPA